MLLLEFIMSFVLAPSRRGEEEEVEDQRGETDRREQERAARVRVRAKASDGCGRRKCQTTKLKRKPFPV